MLTSQLCQFQESSHLSVLTSYSAHLVYDIMSVVDELNRVIGIITRKDLMGFNMAEKLLTNEQLPRERRNGGELGDDEMLLLLTEND